MSAPDWFPNWHGRTALVLGCGPSASAAPAMLAHAWGLPTIAINRAWMLARAAEVLYGADWHWWAYDGPQAEDFSGLRVRGSRPTTHQAARLTREQTALMNGAHEVRVEGKTVEDRPLRFDGDAIGNGGNSGLQAANLAARFGARRIVLLGIDCNAKNSHFFGGRYTFPEAAIQGDKTVTDWIEAWQRAAKHFADEGIRVINASMGSKVECFEKLPIEKAVIAG